MQSCFRTRTVFADFPSWPMTLTASGRSMSRRTSFCGAGHSHRMQMRTWDRVFCLVCGLVHGLVACFGTKAWPQFSTSRTLETPHCTLGLTSSSIASAVRQSRSASKLMNANATATTNATHMEQVATDSPLPCLKVVVLPARPCPTKQRRTAGSGARPVRCHDSNFCCMNSWRCCNPLNCKFYSPVSDRKPDDVAA